VIDGGNKITLDGGGAVQILRWNSSPETPRRFRPGFERVAASNVYCVG